MDIYMCDFRCQIPWPQWDPVGWPRFEPFTSYAVDLRSAVWLPSLLMGWITFNQHHDFFANVPRRHTSVVNCHCHTPALLDGRNITHGVATWPVTNLGRFGKRWARRLCRKVWWRATVQSPGLSCCLGLSNHGALTPPPAPPKNEVDNDDKWADLEVAYFQTNLVWSLESL